MATWLLPGEIPPEQLAGISKPSDALSQQSTSAKHLSDTFAQRGSEHSSLQVADSLALCLSKQQPDGTLLLPTGFPKPTVDQWAPVNDVGPMLTLGVIVMLVDLLESTSITRALAHKQGCAGLALFLFALYGGVQCRIWSEAVDLSVVGSNLDCCTHLLHTLHVCCWRDSSARCWYTCGSSDLL